MSETNGHSDTAHHPSELESAIINQVEYYFGDINLPRDKFLTDQSRLDDGWIPLEVLITFKRLAKLSTDIDVIGNALSKAASGLLEVSEDNKKVRRNPEMPPPEMNEERRKELMARSLYVKGFPKDSVIDDLLNFFKGFGDVENLYLRKYQDRSTKKRLFKGSVFLTLKDPDQVAKFLDSKDLKYDDVTLIVKTQQDYIKDKQLEWQERREKRDKKFKKTEKKEAEKEKIVRALPTGAVLKFVNSNEKMTRENLKEALTPHGAEIAYICYKTGDKEGWVRFVKENAAKEVFEKLTEGKLQICDAELAFNVLEGEEEEAYLAKTLEDMGKKRNLPHKNRKGNWQNKGKYQGSRKRKQEPHPDAPKEKIAAD